MQSKRLYSCQKSLLRNSLVNGGLNSIECKISHPGIHTKMPLFLQGNDNSSSFENQKKIGLLINVPKVIQDILDPE